MRTAAMLLLLCACGASRDGRCSAANCEKMMSGCEVQPVGMPNWFICLSSGLTPGKEDRAQDCSDACNSGGNGEEVACVAEQFSNCDTANGAAARVTFSYPCKPKVKTDIACVMRCNDLGNSCDRACPVDTWDHCYACVKNCGLNRAACNASCLTRE